MLYYKVFRDRDFKNYILIDETELEKALAAFHFGTAAVFNEGALEKIGDVVPAVGVSMGWNRGYESFTPEDYAAISAKGMDRKLREFHQETKEKIDYLIATNQQHLIGKNMDIELPKKTDELSDGVRSSSGKLLTCLH